MTLLHSKIVYPKELLLITTLRCTAECQDCCLGCRRDKGEQMTFADIKHYIDQAREAFGSRLGVIEFTGGECTLLGEDLIEGIRYARSFGYQTGILTNAWWAKSYSEALRFLLRLQAAGMGSICVSAGSDHSRFVPFRRARNCIAAAARLGLRTSLRLESHYGVCKEMEMLNNDPAMVRVSKRKNVEISYQRWVEFGNKYKVERRWSNKTVYDHEKKDEERCTCLMSVIAVNPYGDIWACPGLHFSRIPQMRLGNLNADSLTSALEIGFADLLKLWLIVKGPQHIINYVKEKGGIYCHEFLIHQCQYCAEIFENPKIIPFLRDNVKDWMHETNYSWIYLQ